MPDYEIPRMDTLTHLATLYSSAVLIDSTHAIVAHQGTSEDGFIQTFSWDSAFDNIAIVNTLEHADVETISYNSLVFIDATHFALAFSDATGDGFIKTFSIDGSFVITQVDSFEFDAADAIWTSLVLIDATHAAVAYGGVAGDGFIKTFSWDSSTAANITLVDTLEHDTAGPVTHNSLELIDSTHFALAYAGVDGDGFIKTFSVAAGAGSITQIDSLEHDITGSAWNSLVLIDTSGGVTHPALAYTSPTNSGYVKTFSTDSSYSTITQIDSFNYSASNGLQNSLVLIDTDTDGSNFVLAHTNGGGTNGTVKTFSIDGSYDTITQISTWDHSSTGGSHNSMIQIDTSHYFLALQGAANLGTVKTIPVFPEAAGAPVTCFKGGSAPGVNSGGMW